MNNLAATNFMSSGFNVFMCFLTVVFVIVTILLLLRKIRLWYWKVDQIVFMLDDIRQSLYKIVPPDSETNEMEKNKDINQ